MRCMPLRLTLVTLLWFARVASGQVTPAAGYTPPDDTPSIRVGAVIYPDYSYTLETVIQAGRKGMAVASVPIRTNEDLRPSRLVKSIGSYVRRSLVTIVRIFMSYKPLRFFTAIGLLLMLVSIVLAFPIVITYLEEGLVPRLPTAVLSTGLMIVAMLSVSSGLVLDTVTRGRREMKLLAYLSQPATNKK